jgi:hypothetical protein
VWTDSWLSIVGASWVLIGLGASEEQAQKVYAAFLRQARVTP